MIEVCIIKCLTCSIFRNFLVTNGKYHTNMTSIVLCQSGLFSAALLLAKIRGVCIDTFLALNSVVGQEFGK